MRRENISFGELRRILSINEHEMVMPPSQDGTHLDKYISIGKSFCDARTVNQSKESSKLSDADDVNVIFSLVAPPQGPKQLK